MGQKEIICAANWKMNKNPQETEKYLKELVQLAPSGSQASFAIFPPALCLATAAQALKGSQIGWGAQNTHFENSGAFTGENSAEVVKGLGATHCLVGHSERRSLFGETNEDCAKKVAAIQSQGMIPVLCLGESLEQRESGETNQVILKQLREGLKSVDWSKALWLAYEPVWAIGTGKVATPDQANEAQAVLRKELVAMVGAEKAAAIPILYGGSVKPDNARELAQQPEVDGFLIGGAGLVLESLLKIYTAANNQS